MRVALAAAWVSAAIACDNGGHHHGSGFVTVPNTTLASAFGGVTFSQPVKLVQHPSDDARWYVVEQGGQVRTFKFTGGTPNVTTAANVPNKDSLFVTGGEQGLLGLAFDPGFAQSGEIYLTYTRSGTAVLARWVSSDGGLTFNPDSSPIVLAFGHPQSNHNGGDIAFGPDRFLYYSMGDGGGGDDPNDYAQNKNILLGKIMRIDVNSNQSADSYAVPSNNPFATGNAHCNGTTTPVAHPCPEIFAYGFRNPWRMNFDPSTGKLYVGDVGQSAQEEIDVVVRGGNYGWDCREGEVDHSAQSTATCTGVAFEPPEVAYNDTGGSDAVTGGAVYRGSAVPGLRGFYIYTDFYRGPLFAFDVDVTNGMAQALKASETDISAFGQGRDGEVYAVDYDGPIWRFVPSSI
jgi:glucose/arabinose dehydrogenase